MANSVEILYKAVLGMTTISVANSNTDGTGTLGTVLTGGSAKGTLLKTLAVKAQADTTEGMIRIFVRKAGGTASLLTEIKVLPVVASAQRPTFAIVIPFNYTLEFEEALLASTQNGETFNIFVEGFDVSYSSSTTYIGSSTQYTVKAGIAQVSTANSNRDGTGAMQQCIAAAAGASDNGCAIKSVRVKAQRRVDPGTVRFFISNGTTKFLFCEVPIPFLEQSGVWSSFEHRLISGGTICLPPGYSFWASTEAANTFNILCEGVDWTNV